MLKCGNSYYLYQKFILFFTSVLMKLLLKEDIAISVCKHILKTSIVYNIGCLNGVLSFSPFINYPDCGDSFNVTNGQVDFGNADTTFGQSFEVSCNSGYERTGGTSIECLGTGSWSTSTTCEIKSMHLYNCFVCTELERFLSIH